MKLYGNKVIRKMKKHGFSLEELRDLPRAVADPVAVFNNYQKRGQPLYPYRVEDTAKEIFLYP